MSLSVPTSPSSLPKWVFWKYCVRSNHGSALATSAHRGLQRLIGSGTVAVERDGETVDDEAGHGEDWCRSKVGASSERALSIAPE